MDTWVDCGVDAEPERGSHEPPYAGISRMRSVTEVAEQNRRDTQADWEKYPAHKAEAHRAANAVWVVLGLLAILAYVLVQPH